MRLLNKLKRSIRNILWGRFFKPNFYLAHPFDTRHDIRKWELEVEKVTGLKIINPFYDTPRDDVVGIDEGRDGRYEKLDPLELVPRDVRAIRKADGVIAFVTGDLSYGTIQELVYAYLDAAPVYLVCTNGHEDHPWLVYHATKVFTTREELEEFLVFHIV